MMARSFTQINIIYFKGLSNSRMSTFMERFNSIVKKLTDESYGLIALLAALVVQVEEMVDIVNQSFKSALSKLIIEDNELRTTILKHILNRIQNSLISPDAAVVDSANALKIVTDPYKKTIRKNIHEKSAGINGLIYDLKKAENLPHVTKLGLNQSLDQMQVANDRYNTNYMQRESARASIVIGRTNICREKLEELYYEITDRVFALSVMVPSGILNLAIEDINQLITDTKLKQKQSESSINRNKTNGDKKPAGDNTSPSSGGTSGSGSGNEDTPVE